MFIDADPGTYLIDLDQIEAAITPATKALIPVHLFGRPVDMTRVMAIASAHDLRVIEDCAQATGATWQDQAVGSYGDVGCFSFFPTKNLWLGTPVHHHRRRRAGSDHATSRPACLSDICTLHSVTTVGSTRSRLLCSTSSCRCRRLDRQAQGHR